MTQALTAQLYYYLAVEKLAEYGDNESSLKFAALYFANAAHAALQAQHTVQQRWHTAVLDVDPVIRDTEATQLWIYLSLACAQHCYVVRAQSTHSSKQLMLSKLYMGEASLYKKILLLMKQMKMYEKLRELHSQIGSFYIATVSRAYQLKLKGIEDTSDNICKKEATWVQLISDLEDLLPELPHELADKEYKKVNMERKDARFIADSKVKAVKLVGKDMLPEKKVHVKPLPPLPSE